MDYDRILDEELLHLQARRVIERATQVNDFVEATLTDENYFKNYIRKI